jgi:hypothetical protein
MSLVPWHRVSIKGVPQPKEHPLGGFWEFTWHYGLTKQMVHVM